MDKTAADSNTENVEDRQHDQEWSLRDSVHLEPFFCFVVLCSNCKGIFSLKMKCQHCCGACHSHLLWGSWKFWLCERFPTEAITGRLIKQPDQLWLELKWIKASSLSPSRQSIYVKPAAFSLQLSLTLTHCFWRAKMKEPFISRKSLNMHFLWEFTKSKIERSPDITNLIRTTPLLSPSIPRDMIRPKFILNTWAEEISSNQPDSSTKTLGWLEQSNLFKTVEIKKPNHSWTWR